MVLADGVELNALVPNGVAVVELPPKTGAAPLNEEEEEMLPKESIELRSITAITPCCTVVFIPAEPPKANVEGVAVVVVAAVGAVDAAPPKIGVVAFDAAAPKMDPPAPKVGAAVVVAVEAVGAPNGDAAEEEVEAALKVLVPPNAGAGVVADVAVGAAAAAVPNMLAAEGVVDEAAPPKTGVEDLDAPPKENAGAVDAAVVVVVDA